MTLISLTEAKEQGLKRFFTGKPCRQGHIDERYVSSGRCWTCSKLRVERYEASLNDEKRREMRHKIYVNHKPRRAEYYKEKRDKILKTRLQNHRNNPWIRLAGDAKRRAKTKGLEFNLTSEYIKSIFPTDWKCPVLKIDLVIGRSKLLPCSPSLDRINPQEGYVIGNVVVMSHKANTIKNSETNPEVFRAIADWLDKHQKSGMFPHAQRSDVFVDSQSL